MPMRALAARQQEIDCGRARASVGVEARIAKRLAIAPALGMRFQLEPRDDVGGCRPLDHRDLPIRTCSCVRAIRRTPPVSYTHLRAHETRHDLVCRLLLE